MTPEARIQAAIEVLDAWLAGSRADAALKDWGRAHRFAGSGDRAAIRDHVFDAIRCRKSFAALGGAETGRGLMLGAVRAAGTDPAAVFGVGVHGPAALTAEETAPPRALTPAETADCPDWLWPRAQADLGERAAAATFSALRHRAPVQLRVALRRGSREAVAEALAREGIDTRPHPDVETALTVTANPRRIADSAAYRDGLVELQDAHSQAVCAGLARDKPLRVLDYCAGAGGKTLALADLTGGPIHAHDALPRRMRDLPERAARAGARVHCLGTADLPAAGLFDLVLCDAPCSGSGTWRRDPEGKWALTEAGLSDLVRTQAQILQGAARLVAPGGRLVYITCSLLRVENEDQVSRFQEAEADFDPLASARWPVDAGGDGFFRAILRRT